MVDVVDCSTRSRMMSSIRSKNTKPELVIRKILHSNGYRYRLHVKSLPGSPDIVLKRWNAVIFVQGCFWHGHEECNLSHTPKTRTDFWLDKISANKLRDTKNVGRLIAIGWRVIEVWECALKGRTRLEPSELASSLITALTNIDPAFQQIRGN